MNDNKKVRNDSFNAALLYDKMLNRHNTKHLVIVAVVATVGILLSNIVFLNCIMLDK